MRKGNHPIQNLRLGSNDVNKIMKGTSLVWERFVEPVAPPSANGWRFFRWQVSGWTPSIREIQVVVGGTNVARGAKASSNGSGDASRLTDGILNVNAISGANNLWAMVELETPVTSASQVIITADGWMTGTLDVSSDGTNWSRVTANAVSNTQTFNVPAYS